MSTRDIHRIPKSRGRVSARYVQEKLVWSDLQVVQRVWRIRIRRISATFWVWSITVAGLSHHTCGLRSYSKSRSLEA